ncbi:hypothetical protein SAMN02746089_02653 [Caldanaerobius fijiensis DSM 17918]|uniref:Uncharacterized protein n=1 Tax=Caldanaerobius fijiensis DSM 17918 TaxID=1121256 RepID=A0A1M5EZY3_9THEO|nr:hypothetical protein [Caldanaerobius fijiensis]SHF84728.1 hypothetical protein SAMN02746089_02653 [Caldanaerobius fijiensis DSM 17918]
MKLFFRMTARGMEELELMHEKWKHRELGHYAVGLLNEYLSHIFENEDNPLPSSFVERTGVKAEEQILPLITLAGYLAAGRRWENVLEENAGVFKQEKFSDDALKHYFNVLQDNHLWSLWNKAVVLPYYTDSIRGGAYGWFVTVENALEASAVELVLAFMYRVKKPFRFCRNHRVFYHGEQCPVCKPESEIKSSFLRLLRQHKYRVKNDEYVVNDYVISEIERIQKDMTDKNRSVKALIREYYDLCREEGLPVEWYGNYKSFLEKE